MIVRYLLAALVAGLLAGALQTVVQHAKVVPLILEAEKYEDGATQPMDHTSGLDLSVVGKAYADGANSADHAESGMLFGVGRTTGTIMFNLVAGSGFALVMMAASLLTGRRLTLANGLLWGAAGWVTFQLMPAVGLPPGPPGFPTAPVDDRRIWWLIAVVCTAAAIYLLVLRREIWAKALGLVVLALPHVIGAPQTADIASTVPAIIAAEFAIAAISASLVFWIVLGLIMGAINDRWLKNA